MTPKPLHRIGNWYARNERIISRISLVGGFVFNALTLTRVDEFIENFWVIVHLLVVAVCMVLINRGENEGIEGADPNKLHFWLVNVLQFTFGGLLSTFIVFYLRSAVIAVAWPFFLVLATAFIINESLKKHYSRLVFQIGFLFLSIYLFLIFFMPVLTHEISTRIFMLAGGLSLGSIILFLLILRFFTKQGFKKVRAHLFSAIAGIFVTVNALYFLNIIPPLPLTLTDAGIYHSVVRSGENYQVKHENESLLDRVLQYVSAYPDFHDAGDGLVYAYCAVFSPVSFSTKLTHEWQWFDTTTKKWETIVAVDLSVSGGREGGYRTYSINNGLAEGKWRVNVKTSSGLLVGRMAFTVVDTDTPPELVTQIKD